MKKKPKKYQELCFADQEPNPLLLELIDPADLAKVEAGEGRWVAIRDRNGCPHVLRLKP